MNKTTAQIEKELAAAKAKAAELEQALEAQKQAEIEEMRAKRVKGIIDAWDKVGEELAKAGMIQPVEVEGKSERGLKIAETAFNKKCLNVMGQILGLSPVEEDKPKNKKLNDTQKAKIEEWVKEGLSVAEMNRKIYTNPDGTTYQRVGKYVKKLEG